MPTPRRRLFGERIQAEKAGQVVERGRWGWGYIHEVRMAAAGNRLAVKSSLGVALYEADSLQEITFLETNTDNRNWTLQPGSVQTVFSPDGQILAAAVEGKVFLWRAEDGELLRTIEESQPAPPIDTLAFSPQGDLLAAGIGDQVGIWQVADGSLIQSWQEPDFAVRLAFSPDGQILFTSNGEAHRVSDGARLYSLAGEGNWASEFAFLHDDQILVAIAGPEGKLGLWRIADGIPLMVEDRYGDLLALAPDGKSLALARASGPIQILSLPEGNLLRELDPELPGLATLYGLAFSPDGNRLAATSWDGHLRVWDPASGGLIYRTSGQPGTRLGVRFTPDGQSLATWDEIWIRTWQAADGRPLQAQRYAYSAPLLSADEKALLTELYKGWQGMQIWDVHRDRLLATRPAARWPATFSGDGDLLAIYESQAASPDSITDTLGVWRVADGLQLAALAEGDTGLENAFYGLALSPDGALLAAIRENNDITVWRLDKQQVLYTLSGADNGFFLNLAFSPDGKFLATGNASHTVQIWDAAVGGELQRLPMNPTEIMGESGEVSELAISPDGALLAATDEGGFFQTWQVSDWSTRLHASDFTNQYWRPGAALAFSPDGKLLATGGTGMAVSLWRVSDGQLLNTMKGHVDLVTLVGFTSDGRWLYSGAADGTVRFWGLPAK